MDIRYLSTHEDIATRSKEQTARLLSLLSNSKSKALWRNIHVLMV